MLFYAQLLVFPERVTNNSYKKSYTTLTISLTASVELNMYLFTFVM